MRFILNRLQLHNHWGKETGLYTSKTIRFTLTRKAVPGTIHFIIPILPIISQEQADGFPFPGSAFESGFLIAGTPESIIRRPNHLAPVMQWTLQLRILIFHRPDWKYWPVKSYSEC